MAFTKLTQTEGFKPTHKVEDLRDGHLTSSQSTIGDTSFNSAWKAMASGNKYDNLLADLTLIDALNTKTANEEIAQNGVEQNKENSQTRELEGKVTEEVHKNKDGSTVHVVDGKVTRVDYKDGGHATYEYGPNGTPERVEVVHADGAKEIIQRLAQDNPDGTPRYSFYQYDEHGECNLAVKACNDAQLIVEPDGSCIFGTSDIIEPGHDWKYMNLEFGTDGHMHYSKGEKPQTDLEPASHENENP
jgi:hypothetical protein